MSSRSQQLPVGITRVHPHTRRTLRTSADLAAYPNWVWRVRAKRRGAGDFDQLYRQDVRESLQETLDYLQHERSTAVADLRRDAERRITGAFADDVKAYLARRATASDLVGRAHNLRLWQEWLATKLGAKFKTTKITPALVELALEQWKQETISVKKAGGTRRRRWASATLRARALHLSNLFTVLYPDARNPVLALKDRLPPKSPEVEKAQPMAVVMALLEEMRTPPMVAKKRYPSFSSVRTAVMGFARITIQELWSIRDARALNVRDAELRIPLKRVRERYVTKDGHGVIRIEVVPGEPRIVKLSPEALEACREFVAYPERYQGGGRIRKYGYFAVGSLRQMLQQASRNCGFEYPVSPMDFGTDSAPSEEEVRALVQAMRHDVVAYRPKADRSRIVKAYVRASVLAYTGARVGEVAMLEPQDLRLGERAVLMPTEKHRRNSGRMERVISRRRIPLNDHGVAALKLFLEHDLFDRLADRSRVPDERMVPWYNELYYQLKVAARRVLDPFSGAPLYFTPHCFRHSFATALAPLIGGDVKTGAKMLGHSPQTFMRYVRANDEAARAAIERMTDGLPAASAAIGRQGHHASLSVVNTGESRG